MGNVYLQLIWLKLQNLSVTIQNAVWYWITWLWIKVRKQKMDWLDCIDYDWLKTSWGQSMSLSDLNEVSNFSWRCQLSYETLLVWSVPKLECPETIICHRDTLTPPRILNWPKSPHRLGLKVWYATFTNLINLIWRKLMIP